MVTTEGWESGAISTFPHLVCRVEKGFARGQLGQEQMRGDLQAKRLMPNITEASIFFLARELD